MTLNEKIQAYLTQSNTPFGFDDYATGQPEGQPDQILHWNAKLGAQPTQAQLDAAWSAKVAADAVAAYKAKRAAEYPPIGDQLDALWKGGDAAAAMLAQVQAVKAKYPKP